MITNKETAVSNLKFLNTNSSWKDQSLTLSKFIVLIFSTLAISCSSLKPPSFQSIEMPESVRIEGRKVTVSSKAYFHNPNKIKLHLKEMKLNAFSGNKLLGEVTQQANIPVEAKSDLVVPFTLSFDWVRNQEGLLQAVLSVWQSQEIKVTFKGYVKIGGKGKRGFKIPVFHTEKMKIKL